MGVRRQAFVRRQSPVTVEEGKPSRAEVAGGSNRRERGGWFAVGSTEERGVVSGGSNGRA